MTELERLLRSVREFMRHERGCILDSACVKGPDGKPDRASLDEGFRGVVRRYDKTITRLNAAIRSMRT